MLHRGPAPPASVVRALYGTARNSQGTAISFGFFITDNERAALLEPIVEKLVPDATEEGSTSGQSYVIITTAGAGSKDKRRKSEELTMAGELHWAVAGLAPKAVEQEGP